MYCSPCIIVLDDTVQLVIKIGRDGDVMFSVDFMARQPLYEQIYLSAVNLISHGVLAPNEKLPPIRSVASELGINPNTVTKAYQMLEKDGYIYSTVGRGSFVSPNVDKFEERKKNALREVEKSIGTAIECGAGRKEITEILDKALMNGGLV